MVKPASPPKLRLISPRQIEDELHAAVAKALDILVMPPAEWSTIPAGGYLLTPAAAARLSRLGYHAGWPDIILIHAGRTFGIELKIVGGVLTKTRSVRTKTGRLRIITGQVDMHPRLQSAGMILFVCRSVEEVILRLKQSGVPLRGHSPI